jgi:hypothetical protein
MERASGQHPVAIELRREVNFCCPVPDCDNVILTYHHFDPPWRDRQHNEAGGMIAICPICHGKAEGGAWTIEQLRHFKKNPKPPGFVRDRLAVPEPGKRAVYRLGGNYVLSCPLVLGVAEVPVLWEDRAPDGTFLFNLHVLDDRNNSLLVVLQNSLSVDSLQVWDCFLNTHGNHLLVRQHKGTVALDLRLRRLTMVEFKKYMEADQNASRASLAKLSQDVFGWIPADIATELQTGDRDKWLAGIEQTFLAAVNNECVNSDGMIAMIDIVRGRLHGNGRSLTIRNGITAGSTMKSCISWQNAGGFLTPGFLRLKKVYEKMRSSFNLQDAMIVQREEFINEMSSPRNPEVSSVYNDACQRYPAIMAVAAGLQALRVAQRTPNFVL